MAVAILPRYRGAPSAEVAGETEPPLAFADCFA